MNGPPRFPLAGLLINRAVSRSTVRSLCFERPIDVGTAQVRGLHDLARLFVPEGDRVARNQMSCVDGSWHFSEQFAPLASGLYISENGQGALKRFFVSATKTWVSWSVLAAEP